MYAYGGKGTLRAELCPSNYSERDGGMYDPPLVHHPRPSSRTTTDRIIINPEDVTRRGSGCKEEASV